MCGAIVVGALARGGFGSSASAVGRTGPGNRAVATRGLLLRERCLAFWLRRLRLVTERFRDHRPKFRTFPTCPRRIAPANDSYREQEQDWIESVGGGGRVGSGRWNCALPERPTAQGLACGNVPGGLFCGLLDRVFGRRDRARRRGDGDLSSRLPAIRGRRRRSVPQSNVASVRAGRLRPPRLGASALLALLVVLAPVLSYAAPAQAQNATDVCDRTDEVETEIVNAIAGVDDCADLTAAQLADITSPSLRFRNLSSLKAGDFDGLSGLTTLNLAGNSIETLPAAIFDELAALTTLELGGADLTSLSADISDELTSLTLLRLNSNSLASLPDEVFAELTSLDRLNLSPYTGAPFKPTASAGADRSVSGGDSVIQGGFYGPDHVEAAGIFEQSNIVGAFGTKRQ